jgi:hypothetical protein
VAVGGQLGCLNSAGQSAQAAWDSWPGCVVSAGLETAGRDNLLPVSNPDGEGARSAVQHQVGTVVGLLQGRDNSVAAYLIRGGGMQEACWKLIRQLLARVVFARQRKCRSIYDFSKFVNYLICRKFKNSFGKTRGTS